MSKSEPAKSRWQTLAGIIAGIAALITAVAGLMVAIHQTGWFSRSPSEGEPSVRAGALPTTERSAGGSQSSSSAPASTSAVAISLPALRDYKLGSATFTLLGATLAPRNSGTNTLAVRVRMLNEGRYPGNFSDDQFRLVVDGVPQSPVGGLNEVVAAQAAEEGDLVFAVARAVTDAELRILVGGERSDIPLAFAGTPGP